MTPQEVIQETNTSQRETGYPDDVTEKSCGEMEQLLQNRRVNLHQRHLHSRWAKPRQQPEKLDVDDIKCFMIKKIFLKDRYYVDSGLEYKPPTAPHRKHIRIKSGTDGRKYMPVEGTPKIRLIKSATTTGATWRGYNALNRPTQPDPIPQLHTESLQIDRSQKEEHLQQWRDQVVKKVLIKRQKYSIPIDPTAPRTALSVENSRTLPSPFSGRNTPSRAPSLSPHPVSVGSSDEAVIGVPSYWKNTKPKYRSHLQSWKIRKL